MLVSKTTSVLKVDLRQEHACINIHQLLTALWWHAVTAMNEGKYSVHDLLICSEIVIFCEFDCISVLWQLDWKLIGLFLTGWG